MVSPKMSREMKRDTFCVTDRRTDGRTEELGILVVGFVFLMYHHILILVTYSHGASAYFKFNLTFSTLPEDIHTWVTLVVNWW